MGEEGGGEGTQISYIFPLMNLRLLYYKGGCSGKRLARSRGKGGGVTGRPAGAAARPFSA